MSQTVSDPIVMERCAKMYVLGRKSLLEPTSFWTVILLIAASISAGCSSSDRAPPWALDEVREGLVNSPALDGRIKRMKVLAWHSEGYDAPPIRRWQNTLLWLELSSNEPAKNFALVRMVRSEKDDLGWVPEMNPHGDSPIRYFENPPESRVVEAFMRDWLGPYRAGARLYDSAILSETWTDLTGEAPTAKYLP
jgi:hypothetical protein